MHHSSGAQPCHRPAATSILQPLDAAQGSSSGDTPPTSPRLNPPDSNWSQPQSQSNGERSFQQPGSTSFLAAYLTAGGRGDIALFDAIESQQEDADRDPRTRTQDLAPDFRPLPSPEPANSPETFGGLVVLMDPDDEEAQSRSSTYCAKTAASGCCVPASCNLV